MDKKLIGARIKALRKSRGFHTQEELAAALRNKYDLKTDRAMVGKWKLGIKPLKCTLLNAWQTFYAHQWIIYQEMKLKNPSPFPMMGSTL